MLAPIMLTTLSRSVRSLTLKFQPSLSLRNERCFSSQNEKPKQPLSRYMSFVKEERQNITGMSVPEMGKLLGKKWKDLSDVQKHAYNPDYEAQMARFKEERQKYYETLTEEERQQLKTEAAKKKEQKAKAKLKKLATTMGKPKGACNSFGIFVSQQLSLSPASTLQDGKTKLMGIADEWKKMTAADKQQYEAEAAKRKEKYNEDMESWEKEMLEAGYPHLVRRKNAQKASTETKNKKKKIKTKTKKSKDTQAC